MAFEDGADGVELDVQFSAEGRAVVIHDDTLDRTTSCTGRVRDRSIAELEPCRLGNGEPLHPLEEVLEVTAGWFAMSFVEIKIPEDAFTTEEVVARTDTAIDAVLASGESPRVALISYDETALRRVALRRGEGVVGGWDSESADGISEAHRAGLGWTLMPMRVLEPWMGDVIEGLGGRLAVYVVATPDDFARASRGGAYALLGDSVRTLAALTGRPPRRR